MWRNFFLIILVILLLFYSLDNPHSPGQIRGLVPERNQEAFYTAFGIKPGYKMYLAPEKRVTIW